MELAGQSSRSVSRQGVGLPLVNTGFELGQIVDVLNPVYKNVLLDRSYEVTIFFETFIVGKNHDLLSCFTLILKRKKRVFMALVVIILNGHFSQIIMFPY